jgi:hypothetical protein
MDMEIQRVARELYKALSGMNEEFEQVFVSFYTLMKLKRRFLYFYKQKFVPQS